MKLRFRVGNKEGSKQGRKNRDIEALADAMRALKKATAKTLFDKKVMLHFLTRICLALIPCCMTLDCYQVNIHLIEKFI